MTLVSTSAKGGGSSSGGGAWTQICDLKLSAAQATFDTQTILGGALPTSYSHLAFLLMGASSVTGSQDSPCLRINGDAGANYDWEELTGNAAVASASSHLAQTLSFLGYLPGASGVANGAGVIQAWLPSYNDTTLRKTFVTNVGMVKGTTSSDTQATQIGGGWRSTAAVTRLTILLNSGPNFVSGSRFTLWGVT